MTISVGQLCKKLKKINHRFTYEFTNTNDDWNAEHCTDDLSTAKEQRVFCEERISDILEW